MGNCDILKINSSITISEDEIKLAFIRSSGPGGQNVNKVATAVQLRFDLRKSKSLTDVVRERLFEIAGNRITSKGVLIIDARRYRTQSRNRGDAIQRFIELVREASQKPRERLRTKTPYVSRMRRLEMKRRRGKTKELRGRVNPTEE